MTNSKFLQALFILSSLSLAFADLDFLHGRSTGASLQQYGSAQTTVSLLLTTKAESENVLEKSVSFFDKETAQRIVTEHEVTVSQISSTTYNVSVALTFEGWVGDVAYTVSVVTMEKDSGLHRSYAAEGKHSVYGIVLYESDGSGKKTIVSGDEATSVTYESYKDALGDARELMVEMHGPEEVKLEDMSVQVRAFVGNGESKLLSSDGVRCGDGVVYIAPNKYRVGSGKALVVMEHEGIRLDGESFETQFVVEMGDTPRPPPVVSSSGEIVANSGSADEESVVKFVVEMFNLEEISEVSASIDGKEFVGVMGSSDAESVTFTGKDEMKAGVYRPTFGGKLKDGSEVDVALLGEVEIRINEKVGTSTQKGGISGKTAGVVAGVVGMVIAGLACVAAFVAWKSRRDSELDERSFASSGRASYGDGDLPAAFNIQRDVYGRGSVSADSIDNDSPTSSRGESQFWQV